MKDVNERDVFAGAVVRVSDRSMKKQNGVFLVERVYVDEGFEAAFMVKMSPKLGRINLNNPVMYAVRTADVGKVEILDDFEIDSSVLEHMSIMIDNTESIVRRYRFYLDKNPDDEDEKANLEEYEKTLKQYQEAVHYLRNRLM